MKRFVFAFVFSISFIICFPQKNTYIVNSARYQPMTYDDLVAPILAAEANHNKAESQISDLKNFVKDLLNKEIDDELREDLNADLKYLQAVLNTLNTEGISGIIWNSIDYAEKSIDSHIDAFNKRVEEYNAYYERAVYAYNQWKRNYGYFTRYTDELGDCVIMNPPFANSENSSLKITEIRITDHHTFVYFSCFSMSSWCNINLDKTFLVVDGKKFNLQSAIGIAYAPEKTYVNDSHVLTFMLDFPAIPKTATSMSFIEDVDEVGWACYNIQLKQ